MGNGHNGARRPQLPDGAPDELRAFVGCSQDSLRLDLSDTDWLPAPGGMDMASPDVTVEPAAEADAFVITASWGGLVEVRLPVAVVDGRLRVDLSELPPFLTSGVRQWTQQLNDFLEANGKQLGSARLDQGGALLIGKQPMAVSEPGPEPAGVATAPDTRATPPGESVMDHLEGDVGDAAFAATFGVEAARDRQRSKEEPAGQDQDKGADRGPEPEARSQWKRDVGQYRVGIPKKLTAGLTAVGLAAIALFVIPLGDDDPDEPVAASRASVPESPGDQSAAPDEGPSGEADEPTSMVPASDDLDGWAALFRADNGPLGAADPSAFGLVATDPAGDHTTSDGEPATYTGGDIDLSAIFELPPAQPGQPVLASSVVEALGCGQGNGFAVACGSGPVADGGYGVRALLLHDPIVADEDLFRTVALAHQSTPDTADDFVPPADRPADPFANSDRWTIVRVRGGDPVLIIVQVDENQVAIPAAEEASRAVVAGDVAYFLEPLAEVPPGSPFVGVTQVHDLEGNELGSDMTE